MLTMENASRCNRSSHANPSSGHGRSGYEPSDTESEWQESPWHEGLLVSKRPKTPDLARTISPLNRSQRHASKDVYDNLPAKPARTSPIIRRHSRSPYRPVEHGGDNVSAITQYGLKRNTSPFLVSEHRSKQISPYKARREVSKHGLSGSNYSHSRSISAPKPRAREKEQQVSSGPAVRGASRRHSPVLKTSIHIETKDTYPSDESPVEINERIANVKLSKSPSSDVLWTQSTDSISPGDIFFSRDCTARLKDSTMKNSDNGNKFAPDKNIVAHQLSTGTENFDQNPRAVSVSNVTLRSNMNSSSAHSWMSSGRSSNYSGKLSDNSEKLSGSFRKFVTSRQRNQTDAWLSCVRGGSCRKAKSPDSRAVDEASFIEKAFVVEELRLFWADKHMPRSLSGFICHKQQAQHLKQLVAHNNCPHILLKGPSGSGKKSLSMALLYEIFGDSSLKISHDLRHFHVQETRSMQIVVPLTSSPHHVELNLKSESKNARYALMALVKEIAGNRALLSEVSEADFKPDYKVIILDGIDKVAEGVQHLTKWIMDRYTDACKIILRCEDDTCILDSVKSRCKSITVDAPVTHEIMEVLIQIAKKENFELSVCFAAKIASKSKQNLRKAIMALEACKAHNYPFVDEQPIPVGWEEVLVELAAEILADPSPKRLFDTRGKLQKLLVEFVHPKLILQKLVEQFLKGVEAGLKRELYYWHAYYEKRLPTGTSALLKLEEFLAKFMSIYRNRY